MSAPSRIPTLDGLRGIAAVWVVLFHFNFIYLPTAHLEALLPLHRAYLAVDLFFILSGYVMAHVYGQQLSIHGSGAWRSFVIARFARLYPLFALTLLFLVAVVETGRIHTRYVTFGLGTFALQPPMLQVWHYGLNWNYPSWSISTEVGAYVLFIFTAPLLLKGKYPTAIAVTCIATLAALCWFKGGVLDSGSQTPAVARTLSGFALGVLLFRVTAYRKKLVRPLGVTLVIPFTLLARWTGYDVFAILALYSLVAICLTDRAILRKICDSSPLRALGDWSYGIYLWHAPIHFAIMAAIFASAAGTHSLSVLMSRIIAFLTLALVVAVAAFTHRYFEMPARKIILSMYKRYSGAQDSPHRAVVETTYDRVP